MAFDGRTRSYIARRVSEGMTKKEAVRCLCRFVAREVYKLMTGPQEPLPDGARLAARRRAAGLTQADVAGALGIPPSKVSRLERGRAIDSGCLRAMDGFLSSLGEQEI